LCTNYPVDIYLKPRFDINHINISDNNSNKELLEDESLFNYIETETNNVEHNE